jgi:PadR family transcriptional regulator AphA
MTETDPSRAQRNATAVRWFLLGLLDPADRRVALERELAFGGEETARLQAIADRIDAAPNRSPLARPSTLACGSTA